MVLKATVLSRELRWEQSRFWFRPDGNTHLELRQREHAVVSSMNFAVDVPVCDKQLRLRLPRTGSSAFKRGDSVAHLPYSDKLRKMRDRLTDGGVGWDRVVGVAPSPWLEIKLL